MKYRRMFPVLPPNHNEWDRMHWSARQVYKNQWLSLGQAWRNEWQPGARGDTLPLRQCGVIWRLVVARRRDWDNVGGMLKPVLDGMRGAELIQNDSPVCVIWLHTEQRLARKDEPEFCEMEIWTGRDCERGAKMFMRA